MTRLSIIVPVYNSEAYLDKCVSSLLVQTITDYEIILVNDGSTDESGAKCDGYAEQYDFIRVIHKKNGGLSDARNAGMDIARGEYIGFVDSDDYVDNDMFDYLYNLCVSYNVDISTCGWYDEYGNNTIIHSRIPIEKTVGVEEFLREVLLTAHAGFPIPFKLYSRRLFDAVRFPVGMFYEDSYVFFQIMEQAKRIVLTSRPKYHYIRHENTITLSHGNILACKHHILVDTRNYQYVKEHYPSLVELFKYRLQQTNYMVLRRLIHASNRDEIQLLHDVSSNMLHNAKWIMKDNKISINTRIRRIIFAVLSRNAFARLLLCNGQHKKLRKD